MQFLSDLHVQDLLVLFSLPIVVSFNASSSLLPGDLRRSEDFAIFVLRGLTYCVNPIYCCGLEVLGQPIPILSTFNKSAIREWEERMFKADLLKILTKDTPVNKSKPTRTFYSSLAEKD